MSDLSKVLEQAKLAEKTSLEKYEAELSGPIDLLTDGPEVNNLSSAFAAGKGVWNLFYLDRPSPDLLLTFQSMMGMVYRKVDEANKTPNIPRSVKDLLLKDKFPVHSFTGLKE